MLQRGRRGDEGLCPHTWEGWRANEKAGKREQKRMFRNQPRSLGWAVVSI